MQKFENDFQKNGFLHIKNLFSKDEIDTLRNKISNLKSLDKDVMSIDELRDYLLDERVLNILRSILGVDIVYFGDSCVKRDMDDGYRGFHRDSQLDFEDPSKTEYPVVRFGIYMQDHKNYGGGLKLRVGSHRHEYFGPQNLKRFLTGKPHGPLSLTALKIGKQINVEIEPGDFVVWSLRTWHSGHAVKIKLAPNLSISPRFEKYIPSSWAMPTIKPRMTIFASFGAPSKALEAYIAERSVHPSMIDHWKKCEFDKTEIVKLCESRGVKVRADGIFKNRT